ncbi:hypothetical protein D3C76_1358450 [compost metagenome]
MSALSSARPTLTQARSKSESTVSTGLPLPSLPSDTLPGVSKVECAASSETEPPFSALVVMLASISSSSAASRVGAAGLLGQSWLALLPAGRVWLST